MSVITVSRRVEAPVAKVWSALSDFGGVHRFSAGVESSPIKEGTPSSGVGAERLCTLYDGNHIQERVTESVDLKKLSIEVFDTSMPLSSADATFEVSPVAGGGTDVTVTMAYAVTFGPLGMAMDALVMRRAMRTSFGNLLAGLDHHLATDDIIGQNWKEV